MSNLNVENQTQKETNDEEWESCSECSVEITSEKRVAKSHKTKEKVKNRDITKNFSNSKTFFPSKNLNLPKNQNSNPHQDKVEQKKICYFFTQKRCKFGEKCFNLHPKNHQFNNFQKLNRPPFQQSVRNQNSFQKYTKRAYEPTFQNPQYNCQIYQNSALNNPKWSLYSTLTPDNFPQISPEGITNSYHQKYYSVPIQNSFDLLENDEQYQQINYSAPFSKNNFQEIEKY